MPCPSPSVTGEAFHIELSSDQQLALGGGNGKRRYSPNDPGNASNEYAQATDPADSELECVTTNWTSNANGDSDNVFNAIEFVFEQTPYDQRPDDFVMAIQVYPVQTANFNSGSLGANKWAGFLEFRCEDGGGTSSAQIVNLSHTSGSVRGQARLGSIGGSATAFSGNVPVNDQKWSTLILRWQASSNSGTTADGTLDVWLASASGSHKRLKDLSSGDFTQVISGATHHGGVMERLRIGTGCQDDTAADGGITHYHHAAVLGSWDTDFATTFAALKAEVDKPYGLEVGGDVPSTTAGKRDVGVGYLHNVSMWGTGGGVVTVGFEAATDSGFSTIAKTVAGSTINAGTYWARTNACLDALDENTTYYVRAVITLDNGGGSQSTIYSQTAQIKTLSNATPRTLRFAVGGCHSAPEGEPVVSFQRIHDFAGTTDIDEVWDKGDCRGYTDNRLFDRGKRGVVTAADITEDYLVVQAESLRQKMLTRTRIIDGFDDHEMPFTTSNITAIATGTGSVQITTATDHEISVGNIVKFAGTNSTPALSGNYEVVTAPTSTTFTINETVTSSGNTGTVKQMGPGWAGLGNAAVNAAQYITWRAAWRGLTGHSIPASDSNYLADVPSGTGPDGGAFASDDIFSWYTDTAMCRIIHVDCRSQRSYTDGQMFNSDTEAWLEGLIDGNTRPLLIVDFGVRFTQYNVNKGIAYTDSAGASASHVDNFGTDGTRDVASGQRDRIAAMIAGSRRSQAVLIVTHDDHFIDMTYGHGLIGSGTDSTAQTQILSVSSSCFSVDAHDTEDLRDPTDANYDGSAGSTGTVGAWDEDASSYELLWNNSRFGAADETLRGYVIITVDESARTYSVQAYNGETGATVGDAVTGSFPTLASSTPRVSQSMGIRI